MCMIEGADYYWNETTTEKLISDGTKKCDECGRLIRTSEAFELLTGTHGDQVDVFRTCAHCAVACAWLQAECGGYLCGGVEEDIEEHVSEAGYGYDLARIAVGMRRKWERFKGDDLMPIPKMPKLSSPVARN